MLDLSPADPRNPVPPDLVKRIKLNKNKHNRDGADLARLVGMLRVRPSCTPLPIALSYSCDPSPAAVPRKTRGLARG